MSKECRIIVIIFIHETVNIIFIIEQCLADLNQLVYIFSRGKMLE